MSRNLNVSLSAPNVYLELPTNIESVLAAVVAWQRSENALRQARSVWFAARQAGLEETHLFHALQLAEQVRDGCIAALELAASHYMKTTEID